MAPPSTEQLLALVIAVSFAAGLNLSAVLLTLGLLAQADVLTLPGPIAMIGDWWVIGISAALCLVELLADKIPAFDLIWNALMTFVRVPAGALLAWVATDSLSPGLQLAAAAAAGTVTLTAHGAKLALRGTASASPEPFSNIGLSVIDDVVAVGLTWFAAEHPYIAAAVVAALMVVALLLIRWVVGALRAVFRGASRQWAGDGTGDAVP